MITPESYFWIDLYEFYKDKVLPFSGGLLEQPNVYFDAMKTIDRVIKNNEQ